MNEPDDTLTGAVNIWGENGNDRITVVNGGTHFII